MAGELTVSNPDYTETDRGWAWIILVGILANYLSELLSYRIVVIAGGILIALGYLGSAFASQVEILFITYGVLTGLGMGCTFSPAIAIVSLFFDKRRGLAIGIMFSGAGVGSLMLPHLYKWLIKSLGIHKTFLVLAGIMLSIICLAFLLKQPRLHYDSIGNVSQESDNTQIIHIQDTEGGRLSNVKGHDTGSTSESTSDVFCCLPTAKFKNRKNPGFGCFLLKTPYFFTLLLSIYFVNLSYYPAHVIITAHLVDIGFRSQEILIVSCMGIGDILGRIVIGWFSDLGLVDKKWIYVTVLTSNGVISICVPLSDTVWMMVMYSLVFTITTGTFLTLVSPMCAERIGVENVSSGLGFVSLQFALGSLTGQTTTGCLRDFTGSWNTSFDFIGITSLIGAAIVCFETLYFNNCSKTVTSDAPSATDKSGRLNNGVSEESSALNNELLQCPSGNYMTFGERHKHHNEVVTSN